MIERPRLHDYSRSRAVLMGTAKYENLPDIEAARDRLDRIGGPLEGPLCGWSADRITRLPDEHIPGELFDLLITLYEHVTDVALFYYVGHGQTDSENELCLGLVGSRTEPNRRAATSLPFAAIRRALNGSPAATKIVILDCCFAGLAAQSSNSLAAPRDEVIELTGGSGAYTLAATAANLPAHYDNTPGNPWPQTFFTQYFIDAVEDGIPGEPSGLRLHSLFVRVHDKLATDGRTPPVQRNVDAARDFVFAHNAAPVETQYDQGREIAEYRRKLAETEAELAELKRDHELLQEQARTGSAVPAQESRELDEAIEEAQGRLDEISANLQRERQRAGAQPDDVSPISFKDISSDFSRLAYMFRYRSTIRKVRQSQEYRDIFAACARLVDQFWEACAQVLRRRRMERGKVYLDRLVEITTGDERWRIVAANVATLQQAFDRLTSFDGGGQFPVTEYIRAPTPEGAKAYVAEVQKVGAQISLVLGDHLRGMDGYRGARKPDSDP